MKNAEKQQSKPRGVSTTLWRKLTKAQTSKKEKRQRWRIHGLRGCYE